MNNTPDKQRTGVALIGAGMIGKTHVAALSDLRDRVRLDAVITRHPERAEHLAEHYAGPPPRFCSDLGTVTGNADVQVAIVATPPSVRIGLIEELAGAGKHILLEKPVARTTAEAEQVVEICARAGVTLGVLFQHRVRPASKAAVRHLAGGRLGRLGHVEIAAPLWRDQAYYDEPGRGTYERDGGGVLITQAIHTIDLALSLTGPVASEQALTATPPLHRMEAEDLAVAGLRFASGAVGSLVVSTATFPHREEAVTLHCEHASLRLGRNSLQLSWRDGRFEADAATGEDADDSGALVAQHAWHRGVIEDFIAAVRAGRAPIVPGREALAAHRLIEAIETSSRTGRPVDVAH